MITHRIIKPAPRLRRILSSILFVLAAAAAVGSLIVSRASSQNPPRAQTGATKIAPWVLAHTANGEKAEFMVILADQADLSAAAALSSKVDKGRFVREALWNKSQATQAPILQWLRERGIEHRSYYIVNAIWVKSTLEIASQLAARPDVARVEGNPQIRNFSGPLPAIDAPARPEQPNTIEPGISYTHAPDVWATGDTGQGIVVASADTGFRWTHNAIKPHYRGWNGSTVNHDYNWHDSIHSGGGICGADSPFPCDDYGHGTHTIGTAIGDDGAGNQIGMAPGAQCIGCRNMNVGVGSPATYMECMEFFLAPYPVNGSPADGDPTKAPDITTNSWTCPTSEGCSPNTLQAAVEAQRAAGIMMVVAAGNSGPSCSTVSDPPAIYDASYTIGALNTGTDTIASFSSRGPVTSDGSSRLKPDLCAPGTNTRSAYNTSDSAYAILSGTSMATPHVAGAVALLWAAHPELKNNPDTTEPVLNQSAAHILSSTCDGGGTPVTPNNTFGNGRVDILAAVNTQTLEITSAASVKAHGTQTFGVPLPLSGQPGVECRNSNGRHTLVITFNTAVVSGRASVTSGVGRVQGRPTFSGNTMTINLVSVADDQTITVTLNGVTSSGSVVLPDTPISMSALIGDVDGNRAVDAADVQATKAQVGMPVTSANFREDVQPNGTINNPDVKQVREHVGNSLP